MATKWDAAILDNLGSLVEKSGMSVNPHIFLNAWPTGSHTSNLSIFFLFQVPNLTMTKAKYGPNSYAMPYCTIPEGFALIHLEMPSYGQEAVVLNVLKDSS